MFVMSVRRVCTDCEMASNSAVSFLSRVSNDFTRYGFMGFGFWVWVSIGVRVWVWFCSDRDYLELHGIVYFNRIETATQMCIENGNEKRQTVTVTVVTNCHGGDQMRPTSNPNCSSYLWLVNINYKLYVFWHVFKLTLCIHIHFRDSVCSDAFFCFSLECCIRKVKSVNRGALSHRLKNKGLEFKARCVHGYKKTRVYIKQNCALQKVGSMTSGLWPSRA